jgi:hypothetical protein
VVHSSNPRNSGGRVKDDCSSKPASEIVRPYLEKNQSQKTAGGVAQGVGPEFKRKKKKQILMEKYYDLIKVFHL